MNPEQQIAELQAQIAAAQAQIAQIKSSVAEEKAKAVPEGMHEMPDGSLMADADMESANLQERNTADALAAYEADKRNLKGTRNSQGDFVQAPDEGLEVPVEISAEDLDAQSFDKDKNTDAQSAKMKRTSNDPVEMIGDLEMDGGRAAAEEVEPSERTMGMTEDEGGTSSVNEKDDFWKTEEGYNKAIEMYGEKPAWVKEPTMVYDAAANEYVKIKEEDKEQYEDLGISADIKRMFG